MIFDANFENISLAAEKLLNGELIAFPTETVYGLGADARNTQAVERIFTAKNRPHSNPLIVHVHRQEQLAEIAEIEDFQQPLLEKLSKFWPGPLSVVLKRKGSISELVSAGSDTIAVRIPKHPVALKLLEKAAIPVAAPSANLFTSVSPTTAKHVEESLGDKVAMILDGGECQVGIESTVVQLTEDGIKILRPGGITKEQLESCIQTKQKVFFTNNEANEKALSPGLLEKHYSPSTPLKLFKSHKGSDKEKVGYICFEKLPLNCSFDAAISLSKDGNPEEIATKLYRCLREMDKLKLDLILIDECRKTDGISHAIMDRIERALSKNSS